MKKALGLFGAVPSPGEPLQAAVDEYNQGLLDEDLHERLRLIQAKLPRAKHRAMLRKQRALWRRLNNRTGLLWRLGKLLIRRPTYNALIQARWALYTEYKALGRRWKAGDRSDAIKQRVLKIRKEANVLAKRIKPYEPIAAQYQKISVRLKAHQEAIEFEHRQAEDLKAFKREAFTWQDQIIAVFKQSPRLHHAQTDGRGRMRITIPKIDHIIFTEFAVFYRLKITRQSPFQRFFGRWSSALPYGVDVSDLTSDETVANLNAATGRNLEIYRGARDGRVYYRISRLDATKAMPDKVPYHKVIDLYPMDLHPKTPWCAGVTEAQIVKWFTLEETPHILLAGSTLSGKSNHVNQMIATWCTMNTPAELRMMLVDLKGGIEFTHWQGMSHELRPMVKRVEDVVDGLQFIRSIMEKRLSIFESVKAKNLASYNARMQEKLPRIVVIVDELATLIGLGETTTAIHNELRVLTSQGRAVGIHMVLCTQHPTVDVLPGWIKTNMGIRIGSKMPSVSASMTILDTATAANLPAIPGRMVMSQGRIEVVVQSPYISDVEVANALAVSKEMERPAAAEFTATDSPNVLPMPTDYDAKLIAYVKAHPDATVREISDAMGGINIGTISKQLKRLRRDGMLPQLPVLPPVDVGISA